MRLSTVCCAIALWGIQTAQASAEDVRQPGGIAIAMFEAMSTWPNDLQDLFTPVAEATGQGAGKISSFSVGPSLRARQLAEDLGADDPTQLDQWLAVFKQTGSYNGTDWYGVSCHRFGHGSQPFLEGALSADLTSFGAGSDRANPIARPSDLFRMMIEEDISNFFWTEQMQAMDRAQACSLVMTFNKMSLKDASHDLRNDLVEYFGEANVIVSEFDGGEASFIIDELALTGGNTKFDAMLLSIFGNERGPELTIEVRSYIDLAE